MRQTTKIRRADINKAAQHFDGAPAVEPEEVTRKEAIRILAPKIKEERFTLHLHGREKENGPLRALSSYCLDGDGGGRAYDAPRG
jgi:hypothetical protein